MTIFARPRAIALRVAQNLLEKNFSREKLAEMTTIHAIRSKKRVVTPEGIRAATVHVRNGVIQAIAGYNDLPSGKHIYDARESVVMPGLVDTHVHINEPGRTDWEGVRDSNARGGGGWSDHAHRHSAQQHSRHDFGIGARNQALRGALEMLGKRGLLGRRCAGQCR